MLNSIKASRSKILGRDMKSVRIARAVPNVRFQWSGSASQLRSWRSVKPIFPLRPVQTSRMISNNYPAPNGRFRYWKYILAGSVALGYIVYRNYMGHNFPPDVAAKLRQGIRAEISEESDLRVALKFYLEGLELADKSSDINSLSDEYTGLQIKIAEMYEKLGMKEEARLMYREIGTGYIQALASGRLVPDSLRPHLIQRDLRVALKTAYLESATNANIAKMGLLVHFIMAQKEVCRRNPELAKIINDDEKKSSFNLTLSLDVDNNPELAESWQPFRDELFNARDMYVALCLATGDIGLAIQTKLLTTEWMVLAGFNIGEILLSLYNVGSILYLQAEELELREAHSIEAKDQEQTTYNRKMADESIDRSTQCYTSILDLIEQMPSHKRREGEVDEVQALSTYGLGVIALHRGDLNKAQDLLREARLRAKGCGFDDLLTNSEMELDKLNQLKPVDSIDQA